MSLEKIAKHLEQHGRGGDTHLVHMTTGELSSLQKLAQQHGGSLTINPHTGLPEAGFLSKILPMVAGLALDYFVPGLGEIAGLGLSDAATAGLAVGAVDTAVTGSLKQGLSAGLGAWGGASLAGGLTAAGGQQLAQAGGDAAANQFAAAQQQAFSTPEFNTAVDAAPVSNQIATQQLSTFPNLSAEQVTAYQNALANGADPASLMQSAGTANAALGATPQQMAQAGVNSLGSFSGLKNFAMANPAATGMAGLAALSAFKQPTLSATPQQVNPFGLKTIAPNFNGRPPAPPTPYVPQYANYVQNPYSPTTGAAHGGVMHMAGGGDDIAEMQAGIEAMTKRHNIPQAPAPQDNVYRDSDPATQNLDAYNASIKRLKTLHALSNLPATKAGLGAVNALGTLNTAPQTAAAQQAAADIVANSPEATTAKEGGLQGHHEHKYNLGGYSDGGRLLKGPGDGVSDGIPATIGDKQPARLADGEFVIPARIVSELGNGSTDAGAKRLYAMMDRIKHARAKAKDIAADTKAYKYLPA